MSSKLAPYRVGSVPYLNAIPLTCGLETEIVLATPSQLAAMLGRDELDAALVSVVEVLLQTRCDALDGIAIASKGEVKSVFLAHRPPLAEIREVFCDTASLTSVNLLRVLLAEHGLHPVFRPFSAYAEAGVHDAVLLIGDRALDFVLAPHTHRIWDLGTAWLELTGLPFVYAVWALRRGINVPPLAAVLREARERGIHQFEELIRARHTYAPEFCRRYLTENVQFELGDEERQGLNRFAELLRRHGPSPVYDVQFVG